MYVYNHERIKTAIRERGYSSIDAFCRQHSFQRSTIYQYLSDKSVFSKQFERLLGILKLSADEVIVEDRSLSVSKNIQLIAGVVDSLQFAFPGYAYVLFGSRARARCKKYSDFDIGVYSSKSIRRKSYHVLLELKTELEENFPYFVDLVNLSKAEDDFLREIADDVVFLSGSLLQWNHLQERLTSE